MQLADLSPLPFFARMNAMDDFEAAVSSRETARRELRWKLPTWRYNHRSELRRAIRYWRRYAEQVRRIKQ